MSRFAHTLIVVIGCGLATRATSPSAEVGQSQPTPDRSSATRFLQVTEGGGPPPSSTDCFTVIDDEFIKEEITVRQTGPDTYEPVIAKRIDRKLSHERAIRFWATVDALKILKWRANYSASDLLPPGEEIADGTIW